MTTHQVQEYNTKRGLIGHPNELVTVINTNTGRRSVMSRKNLGRVKGFKIFDPTLPPVEIKNKGLGDEVMRELSEKDKEIAALKAQLAKADPVMANVVPQPDKPARKPGRPPGAKNKIKS